MQNQAAASTVQVFFPTHRRAYAYDSGGFALQPGDRVFVEGRMAGIQGQVLAAGAAGSGTLPRVLGVAALPVSGTFFQAGTHLLAFDPVALPYQNFLSWVLPPAPELAEPLEDNPIRLDTLEGLAVSGVVFSRGADYYQDGRVQYLRLEDGIVKAVVAGRQPYQVRFSCQGGTVRRLACGCPCDFTCKHAVAVLLQFKKLLHSLQAFPEQPQGTWTAVEKRVFYSFALDASPGTVLHLKPSAKE